jgi:hypothetical protein
MPVVGVLAPVSQNEELLRGIVNAVLLVPSNKLDEDTAAAIAAVSQSSA